MMPRLQRFEPSVFFEEVLVGHAGEVIGDGAAEAFGFDAFGGDVNAPW